jgi:hypothetical protein
MRASISAQGFSALATVNDDGSLTLALLDSSDHTIAVGVWEAPEDQAQPEPVPWGRQASA